MVDCTIEESTKVKRYKVLNALDLMILAVKQTYDLFLFNLDLLFRLYIQI